MAGAQRIDPAKHTVLCPALAGKGTESIDLEGQRVIPGLIDSHTHIIRQGNNFAMELRWDHVPSLADGLRMLKEQAQRTPAGQWIRVVGGWSADQFAERRLPTIDEINAVSPEVPVYVLHLYDRAWLNRAALRAIRNFQISVIMLVCDIARMEVATAERFFSCLWVLEVPFHDGIAPDHDLALGGAIHGHLFHGV